MTRLWWMAKWSLILLAGILATVILCPFVILLAERSQRDGEGVVWL